MKPPPSPKTPNVAELPVFKRDGGDTGLTTLQLKLKIREELQKDSIILSEYPYSAANQVSEWVDEVLHVHTCTM